MGFIIRLNSHDLVNDPKNGQEVYPITSTNAVYREGTGQSLETVLDELSNNANRKVVSNVTQDFAHNKIHIDYTDNTSADIIYDRLGDFTISDSTSNGVKTYTLTFKKPDNTTVSRTFDVPVALSALSDDSSHRLVSDSEKNTWNNKSDFTGYTSNNKLSASYISGLASVATSGSYSDLSGTPNLAPLTTISLKNSTPHDGGDGNIDTNNSYYQFIKIGYIVQLQFHIKYKSNITIPQYDYLYAPTDANIRPRGSYTGIAVFQMSESVAGSGVSGDIENLIPFKVETTNNGFSLQVMNSHRMTDIWGSVVYVATNDNSLE